MGRGGRRYRMGVRGERMAETRSRIVDAAVALHEEVGPRETTIKAIAERAGVERLTVYRHFPDERAILEACSASWLEQNAPPDPATWEGIEGAADRCRVALEHLYAFFSGGQRMLTMVERDRHLVEPLEIVARRFDQYLDNLAEGLADAWSTEGSNADLRRLLRVVVRFRFWASLHGELPADSDKVRLALAWLGALGTGGGRT